MKITNDDLYKWFELKGIKPGIEIKIDGVIYDVIKKNEEIYIATKVRDVSYLIGFIFNKDFEIISFKKRVGDLDINDKDNFYNYGLSVLLDYKSNLCDFPKDIETIYQFLEYWKAHNGNLRNEQTEKIFTVLKELCDKEIDGE